MVKWCKHTTQHFYGERITEPCAGCLKEFTYIVRTVCKRYCSTKCMRFGWQRDHGPVKKKRTGSCIRGCGRIGYAARSGKCTACYTYELRHPGLLGPATVSCAYYDKLGYIYERGYWDHPLSARKGIILQHRRIAYAKYGAGPQQCFWCGISIRWSKSGKAVLDVDACTVDHLNEDRSDNREDNLVLSCTRCNISRGRMRPFIRSLLPERIDFLVKLINTTMRSNTFDYANPITRRNGFSRQLPREVRKTKETLVLDEQVDAG